MKLCYPVASPDCKGALMTFYGDFDKNLSILKEYGYNGIELLVKDVKDINIDDLLRSVQKFNLEVAALSTGPIPAENNLFLASNNPQIRKEGFRRALDIANLANELKVPMVIGKFRGLVDEINRGNNLDALKTVLRNLCTAAKPNGGITVEIQQAGPVNTFTGIDDALSLYDEIGMDNFTLMPDTFHQQAVDQYICAGLIKLRGKIGFVHLSDTDRLIPGFGAIPFKEVLPVFKAIDYDGYFSMEVTQNPDSQTAARLCVNNIRNL
jgi:sugar phosphate isomerase/epimerase